MPRQKYQNEGLIPRLFAGLRHTTQTHIVRNGTDEIQSTHMCILGIRVHESDHREILRVFAPKSYFGRMYKRVHLYDIWYASMVPLLGKFIKIENASDYMCQTSHWTFLQQAWVSSAAPGRLLDNSPPLYLSWKKLGISKNVSLLLTRSRPGHWDTESVGITANCQTRVTSADSQTFIKKIFIYNSL